MDSLDTASPQHLTLNPAVSQPAIAPYNFIPLPAEVVVLYDRAEALPFHDRFDSGHSTGYFDVTLEVKSPLYIRCGLSNHGENSEFLRGEGEKSKEGNAPFRSLVKNKSDFYHVKEEDQPILPGSSLRGMLRSVLEIASFSAPAFMTKSRLVYRAVGDKTSLGEWYRAQMTGGNRAVFPRLVFDYPSVQMKGGYLIRQRHKDGDWQIRPAKEYPSGSAAESIIHVDESTTSVRTIIGRSKHTCFDVWVNPKPRSSSYRGVRGRSRSGDIQLTLNLACTDQIYAADDPAAKTVKGLVKGKLVVSDSLPPAAHSKHMHCVIYERDDSREAVEKTILIPDELWQTYQDDYKACRKVTRNLQKEAEQHQEGSPVFYLLDSEGALVYFGATMMFRLPYQNTIGDMIPQNLRKSYQEIDYAEALFGYVRDKRELPKSIPQGDPVRAYAGRVYVTDGTLQGDYPPKDLWLTESVTATLVPPVLSSPKPTTFQHYLVQKNQNKEDLSHYDSPKKDQEGNVRGHETILRGHKRYWHRGKRTQAQLTARAPRAAVQEILNLAERLDQMEPADQNYEKTKRNYERKLRETQLKEEDKEHWLEDTDPQADPASLGLFRWNQNRKKWEVNPQSSQHTQFKPVKPGVQFQFRIYFENLTVEELGALCWTLHPQGEAEKEYCHSLGMGQPLGMGAVKLTATLHLTERLERYSALFTEDRWACGENDKRKSFGDDPASLAILTQPFEKHILSRLKSDKIRLYGLDRIQALLKMMEWPGPNPDKTCYQHLQQFKDRRVLPNPLDSYFSVNGGTGGTPKQSSPGDGGKSNPRPSQRPERNREFSAYQNDGLSKSAAPERRPETPASLHPQGTMPASGGASSAPPPSPAPTDAGAMLQRLHEERRGEKPRWRPGSASETVTFIEMGRAGEARVRTEDGKEIKCAGIQPFLPQKLEQMKTNTFKAKVTRNEKAEPIKAVFHSYGGS
jgi:CRISPR-associated protein (TIGR03986 family)